MKKYRRLTYTDRLKIDALYNAGHSYRYIAQQLGFSVSSVYTEIQHGLYPHMGAETTRRPFHYSAQIAQDYADQQATSKGVPIKLGHRYDYVNHVAQEIKAGRSVVHICNDLRKQKKWTVSPSTLYRYIDLGYIPGVTNKHLPEKSRRKRPKGRVVAARPPKGTSIERRPYDINARSSFGHWELDSVIGKAQGKRQSLLVLTERMTHFEIIVRASAKTSAATVHALDSTLSKFPKGAFKTITVDNGSEFQDCYGMEHDRAGNKRLSVYYCHPYTSCERGSNERANRIIRRFFPKGKSMAKVTQKDCNRAADFMNTMRRRVLDYDTAQERFIEQLYIIDPAFAKLFSEKCSNGLDN